MGHSKNLLKILKEQAENFLFFIFGVILLLLLFGFIIIAIPAVIYRLIVTKLLLKSFLCPDGMARIVTTGFSTNYATEYFDSVSSHRPSRNAIVQQSFIKGVIPFEEIREMVKNRWLEARNSANPGSLKYPELKQHIVSWMGYLFWKNDPDFQLDDHFSYESPIPSENFDEYAKKLLEDLINKPFTPKQSPWEIHVVYSCQCCQSGNVCHVCGKEQMTILVFRIHHCLGDGISLMTIIMDLFGTSVLSTNLESSSFKKSAKTRNSSKDGVLPTIFEQMINPFKVFVSFCRDFGCVGSFVLWRASRNTELHVMDNKKIWRQYYERSQDFPLEKMKSIKNHFGVSFSALVMHCVSVAISKHFECARKTKKEVKNLLAAFVIPINYQREYGWANNITGSALKLPLESDMGSKERLMACDKVMRKVNQSAMTTIVFPVLVKMLSLHVTPIAKFGFCNRLIPTGVSNFYAPDKMIVNGKNEVFKGYAGAGANDGVNGTLFCTLGYNGHFQFIVTGNEAVVQRSDLQRMLDNMKREVDILHEQVSKSKSIERKEKLKFGVAWTQHTESNGYSEDIGIVQKRG